MFHQTRPTKTHRLIVVFALFTTLFLVILARLYFLQIIHADSFAQLTKNAYSATITLASRRGAIRDRYGKPLALTRHTLSVFIYRENMKDLDRTEQALQEYFPLVWQRYKDMSRSFFWIERSITQERMEELKQRIPDISFIYEPTRWYKPPYLPHIVGFTNQNTKGITGVEAGAQTTLAGYPTTMHVQEDAGASHLSFLHSVTKPGTPGNDVILSCDQTLQFLLEKKLTQTIKQTGATRGCMLVLNPDTGEVLAMPHAPSFNPNDPIHASGKDRRNHVTSACHEFGSIMHIFSGLAALSEEMCSPDEVITCHGSEAVIDGLSIQNDTPLEQGSIRDIIKGTNNVGMAQLGKRLGKKLYEHLQRLGFGKITELELPGERAGFVNPPERWSNTSPLALAFGYEIMGTVLQLGKAMSVIANGGYAITPTLSVTQHSQKGFRLYDARHIRTITSILELEKQPLPGYILSGLAGNARMLIDGKYSDTNFVHMYAGIIKRGLWRRVIISCIEKPKHAPAEQLEKLFIAAADSLAVQKREQAL